MKRSAVYLLVLLYVVAIGKPVFPILGYWMNKDYIIQNLCIQKDFEENECQGQCHLEEEVSKAQDDNADDIPVAKLLKIDLEYYCCLEQSVSIRAIHFSELPRYFSFDFPFINNLYSDSCYQPPERA